MKKQLKILNIAIAIVMASCGKHNAEISGTIIKEGNEFSISNSIAGNEPDLLLIDHEGRLRFNAEWDHQILESGYKSSASGKSYKNARTEETGLLID